MLHKCEQNLVKWGRKAHHFQAAAERLPFKVDAFACVFHAGGINFFTNKLRAIREMIWVAKPGTKIVIVDDTERTLRDSLQSTAGVQGTTPSRSEQARCPIGLVPSDMKDITAREICGGKLYCL